MSREKKPQIVEIELASVQGLMERAKGALPAEDYELLKGLVDSLLFLVQMVRKGRTTIARLRRLVGMVSSEKTAVVLANLDESTAGATPEPTGQTETKLQAAEGTGSPASPEPNASETSAAGAASADGDAAEPNGHGRHPASA